MPLRVIFLLCLSGAAILAGCDKPAPKPPEIKPTAIETEVSASAGKLDRSHAGTAIPAAQFKDPDGETVTLDGSRGGRPLLLNLWATWCAPCVVEMPALDALAEREQGRIEVLAVSQDLEGKAKVDAFFAKHGFKALEPYVDVENALSSELKVMSLPTTIFYGADGKERWRIVGIEEWGSTNAAKLLAEGGG
jgi:thiol-disulfide isomerase/thioredoxin